MRIFTLALAGLLGLACGPAPLVVELVAAQAEGRSFSATLSGVASHFTAPLPSVVEFEVQFSHYVSMDTAWAYLRIRQDSLDVPVSLAGNATRVRITPLLPLRERKNHALQVGAGIASDTTERLGLHEPHVVNFTVQ